MMSLSFCHWNNSFFCSVKPCEWTRARHDRHPVTIRSDQSQRTKTLNTRSPNTKWIMLVTYPPIFGPISTLLTHSMLVWICFFLTFLLFKRKPSVLPKVRHLEHNTIKKNDKHIDIVEKYTLCCYLTVTTIIMILRRKQPLFHALWLIV